MQNFFTTEAPEIVKVRSIVPFKTVAPPRVALAAKVSTNDPALEAVAAVLLFTVTPEGKVPTVQMQATCEIPTYPVNGIVISVAAATQPSGSTSDILRLIPKDDRKAARYGCPRFTLRAVIDLREGSRIINIRVIGRQLDLSHPH